MTRDFHLSDVLSVITGKLLSPDGMDGLYNILRWMTGEDVYTHQIPSVGDICGPVLLDQHPELRAVTVPGKFGGEDDALRWLAGQISVYGETLPVTPLPLGAYERGDLLEEATDLIGADRVTVVDPARDPKEVAHEIEQIVSR